MSFSYIFNFKPMLYYQKNNKFCNIFVEKSTLTIRDNLIRLKFFFTIFDVFLLVSCVLDQSGATLVRETEQSKQDKPMNRSCSCWPLDWLRNSRNQQKICQNVYIKEKCYQWETEWPVLNT